MNHLYSWRDLLASEHLLQALHWHLHELEKLNDRRNPKNPLSSDSLCFFAFPNASRFCLSCLSLLSSATDLFINSLILFDSFSKSSIFTSFAFPSVKVTSGKIDASFLMIDSRGFPSKVNTSAMASFSPSRFFMYFTPWTLSMPHFKFSWMARSS